MTTTPPDDLNATAAAELADALSETPPPKATRAARGRKRTTKPAASPRGPGAAQRAAQAKAGPKLETKVAELFLLIGGSLGMAGTFAGRPPLVADGEVIAANADDMARALMLVADQSPGFRRALEALTNASLFGQVVGAFAPVALAIAGNHGLLAGPFSKSPLADVPAAA